MTKHSQKIILVWAIIVTFLMTIFVTAFGVLYTKMSITNNYVDGGSEITDGEGNDLSGEAVYDLPQKVVFRTRSVDTQSTSGVTVKAVITPDNATNKKVDWSVAWVNSSSSWASGKNVDDYVQVIPTSDGALTADILCYEAFGEQIQLTVTSRDNPNATDSAAIDFAKRITDLTVEFRKGSSTGELLSSTATSEKLSMNWYEEDSVCMVFVPVYSDVGTVEDTFKYTCKATLSDVMDLYMSTFDYGFDTFGYYSLTYDFNVVENRLMYFNSGKWFLLTFVPTSYEDASGIEHDMSYSTKQEYLNGVGDMYAYGGGSEDVCTFEITATGTYSSLTSKSVTMVFDMTKPAVAVDNVQVSPDEIVI